MIFPKLAYCDKIAHEIQKALKQPDPDGIIAEVGKIEWDLHPVGGYFVSPKKTMVVYDTQGKAYSVTVEEQPVLDKDFGEIVVDKQTA